MRHNRNEALQLAKSKADYLFFIDADDIVRIDPNFKKPVFDKDYYTMKIEYGGFNYPRAHLVRASLDWKWKGVVHEMIECAQAESSAFLRGATMVVIGGGGRSSDPQKNFQDALLLEKALVDDPTNSRYVFFLAQCYRDSKMYDLSLQNYKRVIDMKGSKEEVHWAIYQIAWLQEVLEMPEDIVVKGYLDAFNHCPERIEPLYRLSNYYRRKEKYLFGYLLAKHAFQLKRPTEASFVEAWIYEWGVPLEYSIGAYWVGQYQEAYFLSQMLLANLSLPSHVHDCVRSNLKFVKEKMPPIYEFHPLKKPPSSKNLVKSMGIVPPL